MLIQFARAVHIRSSSSTLNHIQFYVQRSKRLESKHSGFRIKMASEDTPTPSFDNYEWEEDEEWQVYIKKLEFPGSFNEAKKQKHILKRKQKYFKQNVDPSFEPTLTRKPKPPAPQPDPPMESNPHDTDATPKQSTASEPSSSKPEPTSSSCDCDHDHSSHAHAEQPKPQPSASTSSSNRSYGSQGSNPYGTYQPPPTRVGQMIAPFLNYYYLLSQIFVFVCCLLSLAIPKFYYRALYGTIIMYLVNTLHTNGRPQWAMWYAQRVMQDENIMIAVYAAIFLMGNPVFIFLGPIFMRSLFMGTYLLNGLLGAKVPSLYHKCRPMFQKILTKRGWFNEKIALLEVSIGIFLIFACFFMSKTVILTFIYWQIMHARYMMSRMIQYTFSQIHLKIQSVLARVPFVLNLYLKMAGYLWNMVDPQRLQQQMQNSQGAASGISKYCQIM
eukprot:792122_1